MILKKSIRWVLFLFSFQAQAQQDTSSYRYQRPLFDFQYEKSAFNLQNEQQSNKNKGLHFAILTGHREGVKPFSGIFGSNFNNYIDTVNGVQRLVMYNLSIPELLNHYPVNPYKLIFEVENPSDYIYDQKNGDQKEWIRKHTYCYEWAAPIGTMDIYKLNTRLCNLFRLKVTRENRDVNALVLVRTSTADKIKSAGKGDRNFDKHGHFNNIQLNDGAFQTNIDNTNRMPPVIDETGYTGKVDLDIHITDWTDLSQIRKALQQYDLDLKEGIRKAEVLVIKEIKQEKK